MKQLNTLLLVFFLSTFSGSTQIWIQPNAVWHYDYWTIAYEGFVKIQHIGDSLIQGKTTKVLESKDYQFFTDQFGEVHFAGPYIMDTNYVYAEGDTVFYLRDNQFHKLFDFSKTTNESYLIGNTLGNDMCSADSYTKVVGTGINGLGYNYIELNSPDTAELRLEGNYNTRFGGGEFLLPRKFSCDPQVVVEQYAFTFKCFQDDGLFYNPNGEDCEYLLNHLAVEEHENSNILLYPNPATNQISLNSIAYVKSIRIVNGNGVVLSSNLNPTNTTFDLTGIGSGLYFLTIEKQNGQIQTERFSIK